jgi:hyperosmotically inducible periplasmic protein
MMIGMTRTSLLLAALCVAAPATLAGKDLDARIEAAARNSYNFRVHLKEDAIQVASSGGTATLTGTVANEFHKALAEETVASIPGVKAVVNQLVIKVDTQGAQPDPWLATKVRTALRYHRNLDDAATKVEAKDGVITLSGRVGSVAQRALAADIARNVDGVTDVKNDLKVATASGEKTLAEKIDDASITAQVKAVLLAHRGTHMLTTRVKTDRGVVHIRGEARNPAEKELVQRLVTDIRGVKRVDNQMTVAR